MNPTRTVVALFCGLLFFTGFSAQAQEPRQFVPKLQSLSLTDSVIQAFSIEELERFRSYYSRERERLKWEREELRKQGIRDAELFLSRNPRTKVGDKILMRLAELYYEQAQEEFAQRMQEYDRLYSLYEREQIAEPPAEPKQDFSQALLAYETVVTRYQQSDLVDDALYNIGVLFEDSEIADSATTIYERIIHDYPQSNLMPDVLMRLGEYHFNPPRNQLYEAIDYYNRILVYKESPRYDEALYRLGWSYYRLSEYDKAISYFTVLADDIHANVPHDPLQKYTNPSLMDEAVEYIGLSFLERGGPQAAADYLRSIGDRDYGAAILQRIGDAYMREKEDYALAIRAYELFVELYPMHPGAPSVQSNIIQCQRRMGEDALAFLSRDLLFTRYSQESAWWEANIDKQTREQAYLLTESALRDNVTFLFNNAQENERLDLYNQAVVQSRRYLGAFPNDSSAALIHWNMALMLDTKLNRRIEAFDEYLKISDKYWNSKYQRFAAKNAVALSREAAEDTLAQLAKQFEEQKQPTVSDLASEAEATGQAKINFRERMQLLETPLSVEEERLAQAYDNYIKLFPHDEETPLFLANAGALFYRHNQFKNALKYFKTLLRHFPTSEQVNHARFAILESYFGKADFRSSEIIARKILLDQDASPELMSRANRRLAESIFLNAEMLAESALHFEAGNEYRRMVKEAPQSSFADLALFNAGLEYDKAGEYMRAIETYLLLLATRPSSGYVYDAQNNLAFDYVELRDYRNAALTYERLATIHPEESKARDALYNASFYFARAENWQDAVKVNRLFLQRFPLDEEAPKLSFEIAGFFRQLGDLDQSHQAYADFIDRFPSHPRTIEAYFKRGDYHRNRQQSNAAIAEYQKALLKNRERVESGMASNDFYAGEAEFALAMVKYQEYDQIDFRLPVDKIEINKERKKNLLLEIVRHLSNCTSYGTNRIYEATFTIGLAYQEFAQTWSEQDIAIDEPIRRIVAQKEVNDASRVLYNRSADAYRSGIQALNRLQDAYQTALLEEIKESQSLPIDTLAVTAQDTVLQAIDSWLGRSKEQLSKVNYEMAEILLKSAKAVAQAPIPSGLGDFTALVYQKQVIDSVVAPMIQETLIGYQNCLNEADSLQIESQWVQLALEKLMSTKHLAALYYTDLSNQGFDLIGKKLQKYGDLVFGSGTLDDHFYDMQLLADDVTNSTNLTLATINNSLDKYGEAIHLAETMAVEDRFVVSSRDSMMFTAYRSALAADSLSRIAKKWANQAREGFLRTESPLLEEGLFTFNSNYFALRDLQREILQTGYAMAQNFNIRNLYSQNLTLQLVRFDPEKFAGLIDLTISSFSFYTDSSWRAGTEYVEGWALPQFDDSGWQQATVVAPGDASSWPTIWTYIERDSVFTVDVDSVTILSIRKPAADAFYRKSIAVQGLPVDCAISLVPHANINVYFNGDLVKKITNATSNETFVTVDVSELLVDGNNLLAVEVKSQEAESGFLSAKIDVRSLPDWAQRVKMLNPEMAGEQAQQEMMIERGRIP